ncbi:MAG: hypothetical protein IPG50_11595 [Myxococcales bacterium]|nr:hypothetical protein [Myxococcales bacterium]
MDFIPSWELRAFLASTSAMVVGGVYACRVKDRGVRESVCTAALAVFPSSSGPCSETFSCQVPATSGRSRPAALWYLWMLLGGIALLSILIDRAPVLARNALLPFVFIAFVGAWGIGCAEGCDAAAGI